jgi:hypothetical protein
VLLPAAAAGNGVSPSSGVEGEEVDADDEDAAAAAATEERILLPRALDAGVGECAAAGVGGDPPSSWETGTDGESRRR